MYILSTQGLLRCCCCWIAISCSPIIITLAVVSHRCSARTMSLVEELPEDQPSFSSKPSESDEAGTSCEHAEAQLPRDVEEDERLLVQAREAKERGNAHFKAGELPEALECYSEAIELAAPTEVEEVGVFFANRAAVFSRMGQHQAVCDDCDAALQRQPGYVKALLRRAQAKEALDQPSEALADMKKALEIEPGAKAAAAAVPRLEAAAAAKLEEQKEEMLGKLKELGNGILGKFGMSLDNFKADKDPTTGSYNISFQQ